MQAERKNPTTKEDLVSPGRHECWIEYLYVGQCTLSVSVKNVCSNAKCRSREWRTFQCGACHDAATPGLQVPRYCGRACQLEDWPQHRVFCASLWRMTQMCHSRYCRGPSAEMYSLTYSNRDRDFPTMAKKAWADCVQDIARARVSDLRSNPSDYLALGSRRKTNWMRWEMLAVDEVFPLPIRVALILLTILFSRMSTKSLLVILWWMC
jgi:hypothetical protein